jgi:PXPV repeat (3 copies)
MKKTISGLVAVATVAGSLMSVTPAARAENGQIAAGVVGGLIGGALLGGAIASRPAPVYVAPAPVYVAPAPVYVEEPPCRMVRGRFWDGYGWRMRRVQVCD